MTLNDIKIAALQLMFTNYSDDLRDQDVDDLTSEEYTQYLVNMDACINRCLGRLESAGVIAPKTLTLTKQNGVESDYYVTYDLATLASDFKDIVRITKKTQYEYLANVHYELEGDSLILPLLNSGETYTLIYRYRPARIAIGAESSTAINLPDSLTELIPYFIKAELYEEDEPKLATQARNIFESMLSQLIRNENSGQTSVYNHWEGTV